MIRKYPSLAFFVLAFAISWGPLLAGAWLDLAVLTWLGSFGPALAAFLLTAVLGSGTAMLDLMRRIFGWRVPLRWYLVALLTPLLMVILLETTLMSLVYTWLYLEAGGSLLVINLLHTFYDACAYPFLRLVPVGLDSLLVLALHIVVALVAFWLADPRRFLRFPVQPG